VAAPTTTPPATTSRVDEDYPFSPVPESRRKPFRDVIVVVAGFLFFTPTMLAGGQVAVEFPFREYVLWAAVATAVLAAYIGLIGVLSSRTGLSTVLLARAVFGRVGGKWASVVLGGSQIGWYGITVAALADLTSRALGWSVVWPIIVGGGIAMAVTAYYGFRGIEILSWISVPLMLALCLWVTVLATREVGGVSGFLGLDGAGTMPVGTALTLMIGTFISGGTQMGNWTRFARPTRRTFVGIFATVLVCQFAMLFFGGVGAAAYGQPDFAELLVALGLIVPGLLLLLFNLWTTNDNTAYAFGVAGAELFERNDKRPFVVGGVVIGIALALTGVANDLVGFLVVLGIAIPPLGGALIGYGFFVWKGRDPRIAVGDEPLVRWSGLGAYLLGTAAAVVGDRLSLGVPAVQGVLVAIVAAPLLAALFGDGRAVTRTSTDIPPTAEEDTA
jgi:cytosine permease